MKGQQMKHCVKAGYLRLSDAKMQVRDQAIRMPLVYR